MHAYGSECFIQSHTMGCQQAASISQLHQTLSVRDSPGASSGPPDARSAGCCLHQHCPAAQLQAILLNLPLNLLPYSSEFIWHICTVWHLGARRISKKRLLPVASIPQVSAIPAETFVNCCLWQQLTNAISTRNDTPYCSWQDQQFAEQHALSAQKARVSIPHKYLSPDYCCFFFSCSPVCFYTTHQPIKSLSSMHCRSADKL